jgi:hypothetical protein
MRFMTGLGPMARIHLAAAGYALRTPGGSNTSGGHAHRAPPALVPHIVLKRGPLRFGRLRDFCGVHQQIPGGQLACMSAL